MKYSTQSRLPRRRPGMALLVVTVLTMLIALAAYRFSFYMESQYRLSRLTEEQLQARLTALSGLEYAAHLLELPADSRGWQATLGAGEIDGQISSLAGVSLQATDERQAESRNVPVWRFSLLAPATDERTNSRQTLASVDGEIEMLRHRFGLENESAKLSIPLLLQWEQSSPGAARAALLRLPEATPQLVDHWLQLQGVSRANTGLSASVGDPPSRLAGSAFESSREPPPLDQQLNDQLQWLWYGGDLNQNFRLDPLELQLRTRLFRDADTAGMSGGASLVAAEGEMGSRSAASATQLIGWNRYLTWISGQRNESAAGASRINLNTSDLSELHRQLLRVWPLEWANFVVALRQYGPAASGTVGAAVSAAAVPINPARSATYQLSSLLDVVDAQVSVGDAATEKQLVSSPFSSDFAALGNYLARLLDEATLNEQPFVEHAIDVNEAAIEVLAAVPGLGGELAESIVMRRTTLSRDKRTTVAWLATEQLVTLNQLRTLLPYLIGRSDVYSVQSLGFRDDRSPVARYTAIVDARYQPARQLRRQLWHSWDRGFDLRTAGLPEERFDLPSP